MDFIKKLTSISPRYGIDEMKGVEIIIDELRKNNINYIEEKFESSVPRTISATLFADGQKIPCIGCCFYGGIIDSIDNVHFSKNTDQNSVVNFYDFPSVSVSRLSMPILMKASIITGEVKVVEEKFTSENILIGNKINPKNIVFAHFDSIIGPGAMDNAAAVSVVIDTIKTNRDLLAGNLFVLAGNEEISYDKEFTYDGHGFRVFDQLHNKLIQSAQQIIVIDGVGLGVPNYSQENIDLVFQLKNLVEIKQKVFWMQNDQRLVLQNYHSFSDTVDKINLKYLVEAKELLIEELQ